MTEASYGSLIGNVRERRPLIHHITNYVSANDCANVTLGIGASPIMAGALGEAAEIAAGSSALVLNTGTLDEHTAESMILAGKAAGQAGIPIIFDPVGAGASTLRNETATRLVHELDIDVLRGNISEIGFLAGLEPTTRGTDASDHDLATNDALQVARRAAAIHRCIVVVTGKTDVISYKERTVQVNNGHPLLARLTGTGCMCSSLIGSLCGANPTVPFEATVAAIAAMGIAGEIAYASAGQRGLGSFRVAVHDAISRLDSASFADEAKIYESSYET